MSFYFCLFQSLVAFLFTFFFGALPVFLGEQGNRKVFTFVTPYLFSCLNCIAGGCIFGALMVHIIPEALERCPHGHNHGHNHEEGLFSFPMLYGALTFILLFIIDKTVLSHDHNDCSDHKHENETENENEENLKSFGGCQGNIFKENLSKSKMIFFMLAFGLHSFFEGMGISQRLNNEKYIIIITSVFGHKWLESFSFGVNAFLSAFSLKEKLILIAFYSLITPLGMISINILELISEQKKVNSLLEKTVSGINVGSFMFVSILEMLEVEFSKKEEKKIKFLCLCIGFAIITCICYFFSTYH